MTIAKIRSLIEAALYELHHGCASGRLEKIHAALTEAYDLSRAAPPAAADANTKPDFLHEPPVIKKTSHELNAPAAADEVERVAKAMADAWWESEGGLIPQNPDFTLMARAAIAAMRKPANAATAAPLIVLNEDGSLDDYCGATGFRMEDMGGHFWALDCGRYRFHIEAVKRGQVRVRLFDDGGAHQLKGKL